MASLRVGEWLAPMGTIPVFSGMCVDERSLHKCSVQFAFLYTSTAFRNKNLALRLLTWAVAKKHAREFCGEHS